MSLARLTIKSLASPTSEMPERSPLMSAANTGTPARANPSAITCSETVFPVPVAPVTRPWRFASASVSQAGCSPFPMKIFSSVSAILLSEVAMASPFRAHRGSQPPRAMIILHLASRLKPVNALWGTGSPVRRHGIDRLRAYFRRSPERMFPAAIILRECSHPLLHRRNTRQAIEDESRLGMRSSLVVRIAEDPDKFTSKYPASNRLRAGQYGRVDRTAGR